jgi:hypothetical protein
LAGFQLLALLRSTARLNPAQEIFGKHEESIQISLAGGFGPLSLPPERFAAKTS